MKTAKETMMEKKEYILVSLPFITRLAWHAAQYGAVSGNCIH